MQFGDCRLHDRIPLSPREEAIVAARLYAASVRDTGELGAHLAVVGLHAVLARLYCDLHVPVNVALAHAMAVRVVVFNDPAVAAVAYGVAR
jgi:hypothetical protein